MTDRPIVDYIVTVMAHVKTNSPETVREDFKVTGVHHAEKGKPRTLQVTSSTVVQVAFPQGEGQ